MDMFKLLARSTNIQKNAPQSKRISRDHIPSAGNSSQPKLEADQAEASLVENQHSPRGIKRKRTTLEPKKELSGSGPLDFFGSKTEHSGGEKDIPRVESEKVRSDQGAEDQAQRPTESAPLLSEEESRRILKRHKIRVTVLEDVPEAQDRDDVSRTRQESAKIGRKKGKHAQLTPQPLTSFSLLRSKYGISRRLADVLQAQGYKEPTEVQLGSLPLLLGSDEDRGLRAAKAGKGVKDSRANIDLLTVAPTGSGKTLGFMIHVIQGLLEDRQHEQRTDPLASPVHRVRAIILAPTHELADQIVNEGRKMAVKTGIKISGLKKGMRLHADPPNVDGDATEDPRESISGNLGEEHAVKRGTLVKSDILVSTPLLLLHAISTNDSNTQPLPHIRFLVLDEADYLLDPLFRDQTLAVWNACTSSSLQVSLWSATIGSSIESLAQSFITDRRRRLGLKPRHHHILRLVVGLKDSAIPNISHRLVYAASEQGKLLALRQLLHPAAKPVDNTPVLQPPFLIFTQTIPRAIALHSELLYDIPVSAGGSSRLAVLHSDLSSTARSTTIAGFRKGEIWILITTDLLSRGVDFRGMNGVVNYDIPNTGASYIHRVGRTGRQGREGGLAVTLYTKEDIPYVKGIANVIAASERVKGESSNAKDEGQGVQKWLLDALPNMSKKTKKELKKRGVESRRAATQQEGGREARKMRISTKSGYDRRLENKRKGAVVGTQRRQLGHEQDVVSENEEWGGIDG